ncbi:hypothetical protein D3C71_1882380 [compost metagenome]
MGSVWLFLSGVNTPQNRLRSTWTAPPSVDTEPFNTTSNLYVGELPSTLERRAGLAWTTASRVAFMIRALELSTYRL